MNQYKPDIVSHPGAMLSEKLDEIGMGPMELATRMGKPKKTISEVVNGKSAITADMAVQLESVLGIPARLWMNYQAAYDENQAKQRQQGVVEDAESWVENFPYSAMSKFGWVPEVRKKSERVNALFSYFSVARQEAWEDYYLELAQGSNFRLSLKHTADPYALSAWLRHGDLIADDTRIDTLFEKSNINLAIPELKAIMAANPPHLLDSISGIAKDFGFIIVFTPSLPRAPVQGCVRWYRNRPLVQMSDRQKRYDIFWFSLFHELGHIALHGKKDVFIESDDDMHDPGKEAEADQFAAENIISKIQERRILDTEVYNAKFINKWAKEFGVHPAMVVGRLQYLKLLRPNQHRSLIPQVSF